MSNNNVRLNSNKISTPHAMKLFEERLFEMIKELGNRMKLSILFKISPFQLIILGGIIITILVIFGGYALRNLLKDKSIGADRSYLKINNNIPFLSFMYNKDNYMCFYAEFLEKYYPEMLDFSPANSLEDINISLKNTRQLPKGNPYNHTFNMWMYINTGYNSLTNYVNDNMKIPGSDIYKYFNDFQQKADNKIKQIIFSHGPKHDCWPMVYLDINYDLFAGFNKDNNNTNITNDIQLNKSSLPLNTWFNLCVCINNNIISVYINGKLERTTNIKMGIAEKQQGTTGLKKLYFYNNIKSLSDTNGGFTGYLNYFNYYNNNLSPQTINNIYNNYLPVIEKFKEVVEKYQQSKNKEINKKRLKNKNMI